ncbi:MAG: hypothetical protein KJ773_09775, partial [Candidatus Thermoplasmatota archaeon]|nr:hypothetical protein [Candidatus Thermoplasmatota archaeon]
MSEEKAPKGPSMPSFPSIGPGSAWKIATVVLGIMLVASIAFSSSGITGMAIGTDVAGTKAITYINNNF